MGATLGAAAGELLGAGGVTASGGLLLEHAVITAAATRAVATVFRVGFMVEPCLSRAFVRLRVRLVTKKQRAPVSRRPSRVSLALD